MQTQVLFATFLLCIVIQLGFVLFYFIRFFSITKKPEVYTPSLPVSVIICAKNEASALQENLPVVLAQRYTNDGGNTLFEVIVVDDASDDETTKVLDELKHTFSNLKIVKVEHNDERLYPGKKHALSKGVAAAQYDILLMTDADCQPSTGAWLARMARPFHKGRKIVAGYGKYNIEEGLLNSFIRWETVHSFLQLSTYAKAGRPYMAVGRNMACTKEIFLKAQESAPWGKLPSGDDDLLINAAGGKHKLSIVPDFKAFTFTNAKPTWTEWLKQKQRHVSTGKYYRFATKVILSCYGFTHAIAWVTFVPLLFTPLWGEALAIMLMRCLVYWAIWQRAACILQEKKLIRYFPLFDIGWMVYNFVLSPYILWKNKQQWT